MEASTAPNQVPTGTATHDVDFKKEEGRYMKCYMHCHRHNDMDFKMENT
jgi:hypothetical protein